MKTRYTNNLCPFSNSFFLFLVYIILIQLFFPATELWARQTVNSTKDWAVINVKESEDNLTSDFHRDLRISRIDNHRPNKFRINRSNIYCLVSIDDCRLRPGNHKITISYEWSYGYLWPDLKSNDVGFSLCRTDTGYFGKIHVFNYPGFNLPDTCPSYFRNISFCENELEFSAELSQHYRVNVVHTDPANIPTEIQVINTDTGDVSFSMKGCDIKFRQFLPELSRSTSDDRCAVNFILNDEFKRQRWILVSESRIYFNNSYPYYFNARFSDTNFYSTYLKTGHFKLEWKYTSNKYILLGYIPRIQLAETLEFDCEGKQNIYFALDASKKRDRGKIFFSFSGTSIKQLDENEIADIFTDDKNN